VRARPVDAEHEPDSRDDEASERLPELGGDVDAEFDLDRRAA
jgi:hypothetical protein